MGYECKLAAYEGPLDLLLALISKAKIEIKDIFISEITEQYLSYISQENAIDMDLTSDFIEMAATLLYIKSRALLPNRAQEVDDDGVTPEQRLIAQLHAYRRFKAAAEQLAAMEHRAMQHYYKLPEELGESTPQEVVYLNVEKSLLYACFLKCLQNSTQKETPPKSVVYHRDSFSVRDQIKLIMARLAIKPEMTFVELLSEQPSKEELAVTFLSLLELINKEKVTVNQDRIFGDITVMRHVS